MSAAQPGGNNSGQPTETVGQLLEDALVAVYDPILWLRDTLFWFLEAGDLPKANATLNIYLDLTQDAMELANNMVNRANSDAALSAATDVVTGA